ncbi:phosphatase PAP2 family protein [Mycolicibacterium flavescens]|uniref:Phosphatase PAP2 family protein n=1 Tax=Mycolicibacterium flavescens TaxID=1776 RepID=A0A1E3RNY2_MYCFV|nr:phosphatase PAP2 family protein [Mycolicibacterium flavescens]MCV7278065.1 phosphatase PAP2 family protein [Mycolicibacterium flavescens]ODQ91559.1 phosphatase PAP2 family protein [Mycolicibacterium flavescens]
MASKRTWLVGSALAALALYALLWIAVAQQWNWVTTVDSAALNPFHRYGSDHPGWVLGWDIFCTLLGPGAFRLATAVLIIVALIRRSFRLALFLFLTVELAGLVTELAKAAADRPRPDTAFVTALGTSFPSGHALGVLVAVAALLTVALPTVRKPLRGYLIGAGALIVIAIGVGRVVLNVHHPSDVLAGWALGYAYFVTCLLLAPPNRPVTQRDETPQAPGTAR